MKISFTFVFVLCLVNSSFQLKDVTWIPELSTPLVSYWATSALTSWKATFIFPEEHAEYLFFTYNNVKQYGNINNKHPSNSWGWNCALYPGENRPYVCQAIYSPLSGARIQGISHINRKHVKVIVPGEPVVFEINANNVHYTESFDIYFHLHNGGTLGAPDVGRHGTVQRISHNGNPITHYKIEVSTCRMNPCQTEGLQMSYSRSTCGVGCLRLTECDVNRGYYQDVTSYSVCRRESVWSDNCHSCPRVYRIDRIPPKEKNVINGSNVNLNAVLYFPTNPSNHLKAVWEIQRKKADGKNETRRIFQCFAENPNPNLLQCEPLSSGWQDRLQEKSLMQIRYPQYFNLKIEINNLVLADDGVQIILSLIDPADAVIPIYTTKLIVTTEPITTTLPVTTTQPTTTTLPVTSQRGNIIETSSILNDDQNKNGESEEEKSQEMNNSAAARSKYQSSFAFVFSAIFIILNPF